MIAQTPSSTFLIVFQLEELIVRTFNLDLLDYHKEYPGLPNNSVAI